MKPTIAILTDFGIQDGSVGVMKGVIAGICPDCKIIDLSHHMPPQNVGATSFILSTVIKHFPPDTIFLAVVDPGVGSTRRGLAGKIGSHYIIAPDNGTITDWVENNGQGYFVSLDNEKFWKKPVCPTFHGRDIFAPAAAHIAKGISLDDFGPEIPGPILLPIEIPKWKENCLTGQIRYIDHFGNLVTSFPGSLVENIQPNDPVSLKVGGIELSKLDKFYSSKNPGDLIAVTGGFGYLEIAQVNGNAAQHTGIKISDQITLERK